MEYWNCSCFVRWQCLSLRPPRWVHPLTPRSVPACLSGDETETSAHVRHSGRVRPLCDGLRMADVSRHIRTPEGHFYYEVGAARRHSVMGSWGRKLNGRSAAITLWGHRWRLDRWLLRNDSTPVLTLNSKTYRLNFTKQIRPHSEEIGADLCHGLLARISADCLCGLLCCGLPLADIFGVFALVSLTPVKRSIIIVRRACDTLWQCSRTITAYV